MSDAPQNSPDRNPENSPLTRWGFALIGVVLVAGVIVYLGVFVFSMFQIMPWGLLGFVALVGFGLLIIKVIRDRINDPEEEHYSRDVHQ